MNYNYSIIVKKKGGRSMEKEKQSTKKTAFAVIGALLLVVASAGYIVFRIVSEKAYNKKWKDYDECGIA